MALSLLVSLVIIGGTAVLAIQAIQAMKLASAWNWPMIAAVLVIGALGLVVGVRFGVFGEFQINERMRIQGAPVPLVLFVLEGQDWTDFVKPRFVTYLCMVANALFPVALLGILWMLFGIRLLKGPSA